MTTSAKAQGPAFYEGTVVHARHRPHPHRLRYRVLMVHLDLDALTSRHPILFGIDRPGLLSFHQKDHGIGAHANLRAWVDAEAARHLHPRPARVSLLCMPRILGLAFNPLTVFFLYDAAENLTAILYEVNNTFGGRHAYFLQATPNPLVRHDCPKRFFVSPFMDMDLHYHFTILPPAEKLLVGINVTDQAGSLLHASFAAKRQSITARSIAMAILRMPHLGLKIPAAIHWEALKLWLKGMKLRPIPRAKRAALP